MVSHDDDDRYAPDAVKGGNVGDVGLFARCIGVDGARNDGPRFLVSPRIYHGFGSLVP